jgi:hypothetical protein
MVVTLAEKSHDKKGNYAQHFLSDPEVPQQLF